MSGLLIFVYKLEHSELLSNDWVDLCFDINHYKLHFGTLISPQNNLEVKNISLSL